jgi:hypothetical protein
MMSLFYGQSEGERAGLGPFLKKRAMPMKGFTMRLRWFTSSVDF